MPQGFKAGYPDGWKVLGCFSHHLFEQCCHWCNLSNVVNLANVVATIKFKRCCHWCNLSSAIYELELYCNEH